MKAMTKNIIGVLGLAATIVALGIGLTGTGRSVIALLAALAACLLLAAFFVLHFESFRAFSSRRSTQFGLNSALMVVLFLLIAVLINFISRQYYLRADLSSTSSYSLSLQTSIALKNLQQAVRISYFGQEGRPSFSKAADLLEAYRYLNPDISYTLYDLDREPSRAGEYGVSQYDSIVFESGQERVVITGVSEDTITSAIIRVTRKSKKKVYILQGHGEHDPMSKGREGMAKAIEKLAATGYLPVPYSLSAGDKVPEDASVLVTAGTRSLLGNEDAAKIDRYLQQGGKVLILLDPGAPAMPFLVKAGIQLREGSVVDKTSNFGGNDPRTLLITSYPDSPVTRDFRLNTVYPDAAAISFGERKKEYDYFPVVFSLRTSRLQFLGKTVGEDGSYAIAAVAGSRNGKDVIMVFGDSDFATNAFVDIEGNGALFLNSISWLAGETDLVSVVPPKEDFTPLYLTAGQNRLLFAFSIAGIPAGVFLFGAFIWLRRRRL